MKITGKFKKIKSLYSLYVIFGLLVIAVPVRMYQVLNIIEPTTGFYSTRDWSVYLMYALCAVAIAVPYILTKLSKNVPESKPPYRKNIFLAVSAFLLAIGLVVDAITALSSILSSVQSLIGADFNPAQMLLQGEQLVSAFEMILGAMAAIYMLIFGISFADGRDIYSQHKFLAITPLFWAMSRIIIRFLRKISYVNVSDLMFEIFALVFIMLFFLSFARISSGLAEKGAMRNLMSAGFSGMFLCLTVNIPRALVLITGNSGHLPAEHPLCLCDLAFGVFAFAYIINAVRCADKNDAAELKKTTKSAPKKAAASDEE